MADGIRCKYCGWQETEHDFTDAQIQANRKHFEKPRRGKKISLIKCSNGRGFTPDNPKLARKLAAEAEREGNERAMHGLDPYGE